MIVYRLKELATAKGWDKTKVHYASGVSYPTVLRIWNNDKVKQIDMKVLDMLCETFNCRPCDLIDRVDSAAAN